MAAKKRNPNGSGSISQREDGRYELKVFVDTPDGRRKRISVYASTWEDADAERTRLKDLQRKGIPVASTTSTVEQYMQYWLTEIAQPSVRETTFPHMSCWCACMWYRDWANGGCVRCKRNTSARG